MLAFFFSKKLFSWTPRELRIFSLAFNLLYDHNGYCIRLFRKHIDKLIEPLWTSLWIKDCNENQLLMGCSGACNHTNEKVKWLSCEQVFKLSAHTKIANKTACICRGSKVCKLLTALLYSYNWYSITLLRNNSEELIEEKKNTRNFFVKKIAMIMTC